MVKATHRTKLICFSALLCVATLHAKDLGAYHIGDTVETDIITPVALDVIDAEETTARKAAETLKTPAFFLEFPETVTNALVKNFSTTFITERVSFLAAAKEAFSPPTNNVVAVTPADFTKFVTAFNQKNNSFPVTDELAAEWARGGSGVAIQNKYLDSLLQMTRRAIRSDDLPNGFVLGETLRLVPTVNANEKPTLAAAEQNGKLITGADLITLTYARELFRQGFPDDQQHLARALEVFLKPDCRPDPELTQQARDRDVRQLVVINHYDAGQMIVRHGETIDAKTETALVQLRDKTLPDQLNRQIATERDQAQHEQTQIRQEQAQARQEHDHAQQQLAQAQQVLDRAQHEREEALNLTSHALETSTRNAWLVITAAGIGAIFLFAALFWRLRERRSASLVPARIGNSPPNQMALQAQLAPHLAQVLKESLVQELASQRGELLEAQKKAAAEITDLVHRLDELQAPAYVRLQTYEKRIDELGKDLSVRSTENRELLKLKIEMTRRQLEIEREHSPAESGWGGLA